MASPISNQMLCAIGENLVSAHLMAHNWPISNANSSIRNFKGIDLFCQHGINSDEIVGVQVKASMASSFLIGINCKDASDKVVLSQKIIGPWVFVMIKSLNPLEAEYFILSRNHMIDLLSSTHDWYLNGWKRIPSKKLEDAPAALKISWLEGNDDNSSHAKYPYINKFHGDIFKNKWSNIWE